jgi:hypothetical protein
MRILTILSILSAAVASITDCSNGASVFKIGGLGFWPDPAVANENSTISFLYTVPGPDPITAGTVTYSYTMNYIPFSPSTEDLCTQTTCPIVPGTYNQSSSSNFPDVSGLFDIKIEWFDDKQNLLLCADIKTTV